MKNLTKKILRNTYIGIAAAILSSPHHVLNAQHNAGLNSFNISAGTKNWLDKGVQESYKNFWILRGAYERTLNENISLEGYIEAGSKNKKNGDVERALTMLEINGGINKYFLLSQKKKIAVYWKTGLKEIFVSEKIIYPHSVKGFPRISNKFEANSLGYYFGVGFEIKKSFKNIFCEINYNKIKDYNLDDIEIMAGFKFYF